MIAGRQDMTTNVLLEFADEELSEFSFEVRGPRLGRSRAPGLAVGKPARGPVSNFADHVVHVPANVFDDEVSPHLSETGRCNTNLNGRVCFWGINTIHRHRNFVMFAAVLENGGLEASAYHASYVTRRVGP